MRGCSVRPCEGRTFSTPGFCFRKLWVKSPKEAHTTPHAAAANNKVVILFGFIESYCLIMVLVWLVLPSPLTVSTTNPLMFAVGMVMSEDLATPLNSTMPDADTQVTV